MSWSETAMRTKILDVQYNRNSIWRSVEYKIITLYNVSFYWMMNKNFGRYGGLDVWKHPHDMLWFCGFHWGTIVHSID